MIIELYKQDGEFVDMVETVDDDIEGNQDGEEVERIVRAAIESIPAGDCGSFRLDVQK